MYWETDRKKRKEFDLVIAERKAKEKNELWIKELEARDEEDKEIRAARERRRNGGRGEKSVLTVAGENARANKEKVVEKENAEDFGTKSMIEESERRTPGVLESVQDLVWGKK